MARLVRRETLSRSKVYDVSVQETHCFFARSRFGGSNASVLAHNCHRMSRDSQDVLLKPLEDKKLVAIFCTTESNKIRDTIKSRAEEHQIKTVTREDILERMRVILGKESTPFEDDAVLTVIDYCGGHVRDVLNKLEMIAQMGAVTADSVRAYLNLSVVTTYYDVLLSLNDPAKAVSLVEQACERTTPEEVAGGLAEAAMNAFRLANRMHTDFVYVDKNLAQQLYQRYGNKTLELAEFFSRSRRISRIGLLCDVLVLANAGGVVPQSQVQPLVMAVPQVVTPTQAVAAPQVVASPLPQIVTTPVSPTSDPSPSQPPVAATPAPKTAPPPVAIAPPPPATPSAPVVVPLPMGPLDLTVYDQYVVGQNAPTPRSGVSKAMGPKSYADRRDADSDRDILSAPDWQREFLKSWQRHG